MPAIYYAREFACGGRSHQLCVSFTDSFRQAATYVARLLKGEKAADLPVCNRPSSSW